MDVPDLGRFIAFSEFLPSLVSLFDDFDRVVYAVSIGLDSQTDKPTIEILESLQNFRELGGLHVWFSTPPDPGQLCITAPSLFRKPGKPGTKPGRNRGQTG